MLESDPSSKFASDLDSSTETDTSEQVDTNHMQADEVESVEFAKTDGDDDVIKEEAVQPQHDEGEYVQKDVGAVEETDLTVEEQVTHVEQQAAPLFLGRLWRLFSPNARKAALLRRIDDLTAAIERQPDAGSSYVLRGEAYLQLGQYELASIDFQNALEIVIHEVENARWGVIAQVLQDRAHHGLETAKRHLGDE